MRYTYWVYIWFLARIKLVDWVTLQWMQFVLEHIPVSS